MHYKTGVFRQLYLAFIGLSDQNNKKIKTAPTISRCCFQKTYYKITKHGWLPKPLSEALRFSAFSSPTPLKNRRFRLGNPEADIGYRLPLHTQQMYAKPDEFLEYLHIKCQNQSKTVFSGCRSDSLKRIAE